MCLFSKKEKTPKEPQYYLSATNSQTYNYRVYYMNKAEKVLYFLLAFIVGGVVGLIFYGGLAKNEFGERTVTTWILDAIIVVVLGTISGFAYLPIRTNQIKEKKRKDLKLQFRELLDAVVTSIGSGKNIRDAFISARYDLSIIYSESTSIIKELDVIIDGINNNIDIEKSLLDFGYRSGIDDIIGFANVFETCYRKGGNIRDVIRNTQQIITEKMEVEMEIETIVSGSKNEQLIMTVLPIGLIAVIKMMSPDFAENFASPAGIGATTVAVILFVAAYFVGKKMLDIKI